MSTYYSTRAATDSSINSILNSYSTKTYVDDRFTTLVGSISTDKLDTLAEIATALQGDASFGFNLYQRIDSADSSINDIRTSYATNASLSSYALTSSLSNTDSSINTIRTNFSNYVSNADSSINTIRTNFSNYVSSTDSSINTIRTTYATTASLSAYLQAGSTNDVSLNGNVQLGGGSRSVGINKTPNVLYALDISGDLDVNGNSYFGTGANFIGINRQTATVALDISGTTNMSGNLALTKATSVTMGSFDLSSVNMSVFNVSEKYTNVTLSATPTLDYSTGGIFYMAGVNAALTTISITNVPTALNRSISITLMLAQTGGAGTNCFTTGTLNVNGTSITYLKPDATALAAPAAARSLIINQFIIVWTSATPTVIAYLSSMG